MITSNPDVWCDLSWTTPNMSAQNKAPIATNVNWSMFDFVWLGLGDEWSSHCESSVLLSKPSYRFGRCPGILMSGSSHNPCSTTCAMTDLGTTSGSTVAVQRGSAFRFIHTSVHMNKYIACMHDYVYVYMYVHMYVYAYVVVSCMCVCMHVCVCASMCSYFM